MVACDMNQLIIKTAGQIIFIKKICYVGISTSSLLLYPHSIITSQKFVDI
jgi:hypothetical protein